MTVLEELRDHVRHTGLSDADFALLCQVPIFNGVEPDVWPDLLRIMQTRSYARNRVLFCQGDVAEHFFVVLDGWVRIYRSLPDGGEVTVSLFTRGESLAEAAIFADNTYPVTGATADTTRLLLVSGAGIRRVLRSDPQLALRLLSSMSAKMQYLVRQLEQLSHRTTKQRVAAFLLTLSEHQHSDEIQLPLDKQLIAARLGMQPETFSRALAKLKSDGVESEGGRIHLTNICKLRELLGRN